MELHQYVLGGVVLALLCVVVLSDRRAVMAPLAAMIFVSALSPAQDYAGNSLVTWMFPIQQYRLECALVAAVPIVVGALAGFGMAAAPGINAPTLILILIAVYQGILRIFHQSLSEGVQTIVFGLLVAGSLALCLPALLRRRGGLRSVLYCVLCANLVWLACVAVQIALDPEPLLLGTRFTGPTSNPQSAGIYLALSSVIVLWLVLNEGRRWLRGTAIAVFAANVLLLAWTGSRTGVISFLLGVVITVRGSSRRALAALGLLAGPAFVALQFLGGMGSGAAVERLTSTADSGRLQALQRMLQAGLASPLIGNGIVDANASENSLLLGFAAFGIGMVALLVALMVSSARGCLKLRANTTGARPRVQSLGNMVIAFYAMCLFISLFEGILLARFRESLILLILVNGIVASLLGAPRQAKRVRRVRAPIRRARRTGESSRAAGPTFAEEACHAVVR